MMNFPDSTLLTPAEKKLMEEIMVLLVSLGDRERALKVLAMLSGTLIATMAPDYRGVIQYAASFSMVVPMIAKLGFEAHTKKKPKRPVKKARRRK